MRIVRRRGARRAAPVEPRIDPTAMNVERMPKEPAALTENGRRHEGARHLKVHAQGADDKDQRQDDANVGAALHVDDGLSQLPRARGTRVRG